MAKKKEEFKLPPGTPAPWMSTFSDMVLERQLHAWQKVGLSYGGTFDVFPAAAGRRSEGVEQQDAGFLLLSRFAGTGQCSP